jgi:hypothetical protein
MRLQKLALTALTGASLLFTSCIQSDQNTTVNPDGSGKFTMTAAVDMGAIMGMLNQGGEGGLKPKDDPMQEMLTKIVTESKGVDVWSEAKIEKGSDGKSKVVVTGYFKDIAKLQLGNPMGGDKDGGPGLGVYTSKKDADGNWILAMDMDSAKKAAKGAAKGEDEPKEKKKLTDEEFQQKLLEMKQGITMMKGMMGAIMANAKIGSTTTVGGEIKDYGLFEKVDAKTAKLDMLPSKMFDGLEKLMEDPEKARAIIESGEDPMAMMSGKGAEKFMDDMMGAMIGRKGEPRLIIKPGAPVFDYEAESTKAKSNQSPELKELLKKAKDSSADKEAAKAA